MYTFYNGIVKINKYYKKNNVHCCFGIYCTLVVDRTDLYCIRVQTAQSVAHIKTISYCLYITYFLVHAQIYIELRN